MHRSTDREGNEMFMLRRKGKTLTETVGGREGGDEQEMNEIKNRFPSPTKAPKIERGG